MKFSQRHTYLLKLWLLKVDLMYKNSKNKHFSGKNIRPT